MRRLTSPRGLAVLALAILSLPAGAAPAASAAERVDRYLARIETLRAAFHQEVIDSEGHLREEADGTLAVSRPGRFRWDYRTPSEQLLVSDGTTVWLYDVELEQVTVRKADQVLSATPAMLLSGRGTVSESFDAAERGRSEGLEWVALTPKLEDADFREVRLGFRDGELQRMELSDRLGQVTRIQFSSVELNPELPADLFSFEPPPGVDVVGSVASR